jgi:threonine dehydratase
MLTLADVERAGERIAETVRHTPVDRSRTFSRVTGASVACKLENLQRTGSFKIRGASNRIATLTEAERQAGVVAASAGNHAQGVALAARQAGIDATIVMPVDAPISKIDATRGYDAEVVLDGDDYDAAADRAREIESETGATFVHAFDDEAVMAGQGTLGLEILEDAPDVETVVVPIGGGGLIAGVATAITELAPHVRVIGVQAAGAASVPQSLEAGEIVRRDAVDTIADGIAVRAVGEKPFEVIQRCVDDVVTVDDEAIAKAVALLLERSKLLVEGAGAAPLAALLEGAFEYEDGEEIVLPLCGGNVDLNLLTTVVMRGLVERGRYLRIRTELEDRPGALRGLLDVVAGHHVNIYAIRHDRTAQDLAINATEVVLDLETRGVDHAVEVCDAIEAAGYPLDTIR